MTPVNTLLHGFQRAIVANSPKILTAMGVAGVLSTSILAVRATPEALNRISEISNQKRDEDGEWIEPSVWEKIKATYPCYIPAAAVGAVTITCIIAGNSISTKRNAALMSLYSVTETGFREYQEKVVETMGAQKEQKVRDEVAADRVKKNPPTESNVILVAGKDVLCYETFTGRYFTSDVETIRRSQNDINEMIINNQYASQNDFFRLIGLPPTTAGEELGWSTDNMLDVRFSTVLSEDGRPCLSLEYKTLPMKGYYLFSQ